MASGRHHNKHGVVDYRYVADNGTTDLCGGVNHEFKLVGTEHKFSGASSSMHRQWQFLTGVFMLSRSFVAVVVVDSYPLLLQQSSSRQWTQRFTAAAVRTAGIHPSQVLRCTSTGRNWQISTPPRQRSWRMRRRWTTTTTSHSRNDRLQQTAAYIGMNNDIDNDDDSIPDRFIQQQQQQQDQDDTIYALASGNSAQATAVALIRISGPQAKNILTLLLGKNNDQAFPKPRQASLRRLYHPTTHVQIDQALVLYFPGPHSFTGEDCVELHCHGSRAVVATLFASLKDMYLPPPVVVRLAEPGEFTQRAFENGKLDVLQVEGLADLLASDTEQQRQVALAQLEGHVSMVYKEWRDILIAALAHAEAIIDFGDDEMNTLLEQNDEDDNEDDDQSTTSVWGGVTARVQSLVESMQQQLSRRNSELLRLGIKIAIVGPPNAGKSSLFNILAQRPAAIVSNTAGTTRDVLEVAMDLGGIKCMLQDTAGIREETTDVIEQEGMKRALDAAKSANIVVLLVDASDRQMSADIITTMLPKLLETHDKADIILAYNKLDLGRTLDQCDENDVNNNNYYYSDSVSSIHQLSCVTQQGLDEFLTELTQRVSLDLDDGLITRARHRQHVQAATEALQRFMDLSGQGSMAVDLAAEELRLAASELGRITGAVDVEDILDKLFADFCIGK